MERPVRTVGRAVLWSALLAGVLLPGGCDMENEHAGAVLQRRMGFWITPPKGWAVTMDVERLIPMTIRSEDQLSVVTVRLIAAEEGDTAKALFTDDYGQDVLIKVQEEGETTLAGRAAYRGVVRHEMGEGNMMVLRYLMPDGPRFYDIVCTCPEDQFTERRPEFEKCCKSFRFKTEE